MGFSASDRALILGHEVQTNEAHYSLTDKRKLNDIKKRLTQIITTGSAGGYDYDSKKLC